jgi:hypothetical protein
MPNLFGQALRLAGQVTKPLLHAVPLAGDALVGISELINPNEPDVGQRAINSLVIGGGGAAASMAVAGLDVVPAIAEGMFQGRPTGPEKLQQLQKCAPALNVENHLRNLSYSAGEIIGKSNPSERDITRQLISEAAKQCGAFVTPGERSGMYPSAVRGGLLNF